MKKFISLFFVVIFLSGFEIRDHGRSVVVGNHHFLVSVADTDEKKERGLMWVQNLPENYGMIFEFEKEQMIFMWMKNTKIPLDMIFIDRSGTIINIKHQAIPESLDIISSLKPAKKVLEINGGLANKLGIKVGDVIK